MDTKPAKNLIAGVWKFSERVPRERVIVLAEQWAQNPCYVQLLVRKYGPHDEFSIAFVYKVNDGDKDFENYLEQTSKIVREQFGDDLIGWEIAATPYVVKGAIK